MTKKIPKATHMGEVKIGHFTLSCANLNDKDKTRVISTRTIARAIGSKGGGAYWKKKKEEGALIPEFVSAKNLEPFIDPETRVRLLTPITYKSKTGGVAQGVAASLLPEICNVWLKAREKGALTRTQSKPAKNAEILMRGLAHIGIIALVDEATGYQKDRDRDELHKMLEAYISKELLPWTKRFPDEFYEEMFRLRGWHFNPLSVKRPQLVGKLTKKIIYKKLPPGVVGQLEKKNPITPKGFRKFHHHRFLTNEIGNPHLERHLAAVVALMRISPDWRTFLRHLERAFPDERMKQFELALQVIEQEGSDS